MKQTLTVFTICSYSNLNQAVVLYHSILKKSTVDINFFCYLIDDTPAGLNLNLEHFHIVSSAQMSKQIDAFDAMKSKYNAFELCCALKPFCASLLIENTSQKNILVYLDSDIYFYNDIAQTVDELGSNAILLSPHFISPPRDFIKISELDINNSGLYNGGFFALSASTQATEFLVWWKSRTLNFCTVDFANGQFVDQIWLNYVPIYFEKVKISKHLGFNFAYWNFHERIVDRNASGELTINNSDLLVFVHFSGYRLYRKDLISIHQNKFRFEDFPLITELFNNYATELELNSKKLNLPFPERSKSSMLKVKLKSFFQKKK